MRVAIDRDRCTGHGRCYTLEPTLFSDDDEGYGRPSGDGDLPGESLPAARRAVGACPEHAISISGEHGTRLTRP